MRTLYCIVLGLIPCFSWTQEMEDTIAYSIDFDNVVVTAQYEPTHFKSALHKVEIINETEIRNRGANNLEEALTISPSVRVYQDPILGSSIRLRGIDASHVAILMDGVPVIGRLNGGIDLSQIPMNNIQRIEVIEGALSNLYGSNAAGGVINIISKTSQIKPWRISTNHQLESIGIQSHDIGLGYQYKKWNVNLHGRYYDYHQYPVDSFRVQENLVSSNGEILSQQKYPLNPKTQYGLGGYLRYNMDNESYVLVKYEYFNEKVSDYGIVRRPQYNPYSQDQFYLTDRSDLSFLMKKKWKQWYLDITGAVNKYDRSVEDKRYYLETNEFDSLLMTADITIFYQVMNRSIATYVIDDRWTMNNGLHFSYEKGSGDRITHPTNQDSTIAYFTEISPFSEIKYSGIKNMDLAISGRYTMHSVYHNKFIPALHLKYAVKDWIVRASYAQGYRSPSLKELYLEFVDINHNIIGSTDLKPELSHDFQLNINKELFSNIELSTTFYRTIIEDRIDLIQYESLKFKYANIDEYSVYGIQPALTWKSNFGLQISSALSIGYWATNLDEFSAPKFGKVFDMNNSLGYNLNKYNLGMSINHRLVGKQPVYTLDNDNNIYLRTRKEYHLMDASIYKSIFKEKLKCIIGVKNVLNIQSTAVTGPSIGGVHSSTGQNIVGPGRSYFVSLSTNIL